MGSLLSSGVFLVEFIQNPDNGEKITKNDPLYVTFFRWFYM